MAQPTGAILWAGEATSKANFGLVEGAWEAGIREAKRLVQAPSVPIL
jgi:monoamine oxidase